MEKEEEKGWAKKASWRWDYVEESGEKGEIRKRGKDERRERMKVTWN